jgi:hypothetical protein
MPARAPVAPLEEPTMFEGILLAVVWMIETVVNYSIAAILITFAFIGIIAACRWLMHNSHVSGYLKRSSV